MQKVYSGTATATFTKVFGTQEAVGGVFTLNVSAVSGTTPSMTVKLQHHDSVSDAYVDIPGAVFVAATATGAQTLYVMPGIPVTANKATPYFLGDEVAAVFTITGTTPSFTTSLSFDEADID